MANTDYGDTSGWLKLVGTIGTDTHTLYLLCEEWSYDLDDKIIMMDFPNRGHFGFTLNTEKITVKIKNAFVTSVALWQGANSMKAGLKAIMDADTIDFTAKIDSGGTLELFDGVAGNDTMPVVVNNIKGKVKVFRGNTTYFVIKLITLVQSGTLT